MADIVTEFASALSPDQARTAQAVQQYAAWQASRRAGPFTPGGNDDVDLRTYLLEQRIAGVGRKALGQIVEALKQFYAWALAAGHIDFDPFDEFSFDRPFLTRSQIRRRQGPRAADPQEREIGRLRALNRLAEELNRSTDLRSVLTVTLETLVEIMGLPTAWVFLWTGADLPARFFKTPAPHDFALAADIGLPPGLTHNHCYYLREPPDCHCQYLMRDGQLMRAVNVVECTRLQDSDEATGDNQGLLFHATVPLMSQGKPFGILNVATDEWQFLSAADLQLLSSVGGQTSIAIERARLFHQSTQLGALEERNRLAREIHDTLAQGLTAIALHLETADALLDGKAGRAGRGQAQQAVRQALGLTRSNLEEARRSVLDLRAASLEGRTLAEALADLAAQDEWASRWNLRVSLETSPGHLALPAPVETGLYRVAQEALMNAARHAHARHAMLQLTFSPVQVQLVVSDDGRGFDPKRIPQGRYGLIGLNERVKLLGGSLHLESSPGQGTLLQVTIPLETRA